MTSPRQIVKAAAELVLTGAGIAALGRRRMRGRTLILAYHNIVPDGEPCAGDLSLHLEQRRFAEQLDVLSRTHEVVRLEEAFIDGTGSNRPRAVITFDDATQGTITAGVAELAARGLPATIFVPPGFVGGRGFWWDALSNPGRRGPGEDVRNHALTELGGSDARIRGWAASHSFAIREVPPHQTCATEDQLHEAARQGIEFGSHTWSHPNLTMLSAAELESELKRPLVWLSERFSTTVPWLAYPYGLSNAAVADAASSAGYAGALRVDGGWLPGTADRQIVRYQLPRQNIPSGLSTRGFELRVSGVMAR